MYGEHTVHPGIYNTGLSFGPDGALYIADWMNGPSERGRIWKLEADGDDGAALRKETQGILAQGFKSDPFLSWWNFCSMRTCGYAVEVSSS